MLYGKTIRMCTSEAHFYKMSVGHRRRLNIALLFSRQRKKCMTFDMDGTRQMNKMHIFLTRDKALSILFLLCLLIQTVYCKTLTLQQHTAPSDKVRTTSFSLTTSLLPQFESQTLFLPERERQGILVPTSLKMKAPDQGYSQKLRHKKQKHKKKTNSRKSKRKDRKYRRFSRALFGLEQKSCPTITTYVFKLKAVDIFGDTVDIYPVINIGNLALDQYFYESFCDVEQCSCGGVDNKKFKSSCQTTHSYTYAKVVKSGEIGWSYIKVRSGCSCVIQEKRRNLKSVVDLIS